MSVHANCVESTTSTAPSRIENSTSIFSLSSTDRLISDIFWSLLQNRFSSSLFLLIGNFTWIVECAAVWADKAWLDAPARRQQKVFAQKLCVCVLEQQQKRKEKKKKSLILNKLPSLPLPRRSPKPLCTFPCSISPPFLSLSCCRSTIDGIDYVRMCPTRLPPLSRWCQVLPNFMLCYNLKQSTGGSKEGKLNKCLSLSSGNSKWGCWELKDTEEELSELWFHFYVGANRTTFLPFKDSLSTCHKHSSDLSCWNFHVTTHNFPLETRESVHKQNNTQQQSCEVE